MTDVEKRKMAKEFSERWKDKGYEKGHTQQFWIDLLENVLDVSNATNFIEFEDTIKIENAQGFIDAYIPSTKILIEQKSIEKDLRKPIKQSDGSLLNPFQQARRYASQLPYEKIPRWIITSNFKSFLIYDMNNPNGEPEEILLKNLSKEYYRLSFITDSKNEHIKKEEELSFKAGEIVGILYDAFAKQYNDLNNEKSQKSLNELCVRLVFCLYAEDALLFGKRNIFHDYLSKFTSLDEMRTGLINLFKILDTKLVDRDPYGDNDLNQFPYVNGGLFSNQNIEIPRFTEEIKNIILSKASDDFDWSEISPTIFGAVFESTLNPETRRAGGMHYTSIENIHKVIDPLFLNDLRDELNVALSYKNEKNRNEALENFQNKLSSLTFFDPACGSGNFLTETFLSLRRLENEAILAKQNGLMALDMGDVIKVHIDQMYGIEINDFAVKVATTALWIAESQMLKETEKILLREIEYLPLKNYTNICEENALCVDWNNVLPNNRCSYIMGNPPFIGARLMTKDQKNDLLSVFPSNLKTGNLDYVSCWYYLCSEYMKDTDIKAALVSTNSITQGEQVPILWKLLFEKGIKINFCHKTFRWDSEASIKAHVHCVIVGFSYINNKDKFIYDNGKIISATHINGYLVDASDITIESRNKHYDSNVKKMDFGSMPNDGGFLSNFTEEEKNKIIEKYPNSTSLFKKIVGADEFINNKTRYCLWLDKVDPNIYRNIPPIMDAIRNVYNNRSSSNREATKKLASTPFLFGEIRHPYNDYILVPSNSSERRRYIPIGFMKADEISTNANLVISGGDLYDFGVLTSNIHMAWMRAIGGRLKSDYRYSAKIVYNNFPWPNPTKEQKEKIIKTAKAILDARNLYPNSSLADLYDDLTMPVELRKAHQLNNQAVKDAYGFSFKLTESEVVGKLMELYKKESSK